MTKQQIAVITGFTKMGASIEQICLCMGISGIKVEKVVKKIN